MPRSAGKELNFWKGTIEKENEEEKRKKVLKGKTRAKAGKPNVASLSSSSSSPTTSSSEIDQPPEKTQAIGKGKQGTQNAPPKIASQTHIAAKPKRKRTLEEPGNVALPPPTSRTTVHVKRRASRRPTLTRSSSLSITGSASTRVHVPKLTPEEVSSVSEPDVSKEISMAELSQIS